MGSKEGQEDKMMFSGRAAVAMMVIAGALFIGVGQASAHHQDPSVDSDGDAVSNYNDACPYDPAPSYYGPLPAPAGTCAGLQDKDADLYNAAQDPCDTNSANEQCDTDFDGEPNIYDPCPDTPSGHMLGGTTPLENQGRVCPPGGADLGGADPLTTIGDPTVQSETLNLNSVTLVPGQTPKSVVNNGLALNVKCNKTCSALGGVGFRGDKEFAGSATEKIGKKANKGNLRIKLSKKARKKLRKSKTVKGDLTLQGFRNQNNGVLSDLVNGTLTIRKAGAGRVPSAKAATASSTAGGGSVTLSNLHRVPVARSLGHHTAQASSTNTLLKNVTYRLNVSQQRSMSILWLGIAKSVRPSCVFNVVGIPGTTLNASTVASWFSGINLCDLAQRMSKIANNLFPEPGVTDKYYSLQVWYLDRSFALDYCFAWVYAKEWISLTTRPGGGGSCWGYKR